MPDHNEEKQPWDRQKNESAASYALFNEFLKLGPLRTIPRLYQELSKSTKFPDPPNENALKTKGTTWKWKVRAEAYDDDRIARERKELEARAHERLVKRLDQNEEEEDALHDAIMEVLEIDDEDTKLGSKAYAVDCFSKAKKNASDSQRLDFGEPTSISKDSLDLKKKGDKELSEIKDLFAEAEKANESKHREGG
jgi:hypothetical protein